MRANVNALSEIKKTTKNNSLKDLITKYFKTNNESEQRNFGNEMILLNS